jgi:hypothetical protein
MPSTDPKWLTYCFHNIKILRFWYSFKIFYHIRFQDPKLYRANIIPLSEVCMTAMLVENLKSLKYG